MKRGYVGIDYNGSEAETYESVRAHVTDLTTTKTKKKLFKSGDVVKDFADAHRWMLKNQVDDIGLSSDVDHFMMDDKKHLYYWDNESNLIGYVKDKKVNHLENQKCLLDEFKLEKQELEQKIEVLEKVIEKNTK